MENRWYILNVISGQEQKISDQIKSLSGELGELIEDVVVPCKQVVKVKKGKKVQEGQKMFPGYVFVKGNLNSSAYGIINSIPKVIGFLGAKNNPQPVEKEKMSNIFSLMNNDQVDLDKGQIYEPGEILSVIEGPFESFTGVVEEFDQEKQRVKISILIFGRATSVDLDINQVEKSS